VRVINVKVEVRPASEGDLGAINHIYNHYVVESHVTFDDEPMSMDARREWFAHYVETGRHRVLVATDGDEVVGYATSSRYRPKPGYVTSVETSIYLAPDAVGKGAGAKLYAELFKSLEGEDIHRAYAGIALPNRRRSGCMNASASNGWPFTPSRAGSSAATGTSPGSRSRLER